MYQILEQIQTDVYTIGDTYTKVRVRLVCDALSDLPGVHDISGLELQMGSTAHIVQTAQNMMMQSNGTWSEQTTSSIASLVTSISNLESEMTGVHSDIDILVNQTGELRAAAVRLINGGNKNILPFTMPSSGIMTLVDNGDGTFTMSGTAGSTISLLLGYVYGHGGESLVLSGCPGGGDYTNGYSLIITDSGGITQGYDVGDGYSFERPAAEEHFRVYCRVRAGTYNNVLFKPMVTYQEYDNMTHAFVPYSPTNAELYAMIHSYHP